MAIYSVSLKAFSRSKGHSATGACAYRLGLNVVNEQTGERHDFSRRQDVAEAFTMLPAGSPEWEPSRLWNEAEKAEKRVNSCVARELLVALPHELSDHQRSEVSRELAQGLVDRYRVAVSVGIHRPDDGELNHHAHILFSTRRLGPEGFEEKTRELDDQKQGKVEVEHLRESAAKILNLGLERAGIAERVSHKSLEAQREEALALGQVVQAIALDRAPTSHEGRNPEVKARVEAENEAKRLEARERVQKAMERIEAQALAEGRLMPSASDTPEARAKAEMEQERARRKAVNGPRQEQEREALEARWAEVKAEEAVRAKALKEAVEKFNSQVALAQEKRESLTEREREFERKNSEKIEVQAELWRWSSAHPKRERWGEIFPALKKEKTAIEERLGEVSESWERRRDRIHEAKREQEKAEKEAIALREPIQGLRNRVVQVQQVEQKINREREVLLENHRFENDPEAVQKIEKAKAERLAQEQAQRERFAQLDKPFQAVEQVRPEREHRYQGPSR